MNTMTHQQKFAEHGITVPPHLEAQAEIPVTAGLWRQGDVYMRPEPDAAPIGDGIACNGINVVRGDADRNAHILDCPNGRWHPGTYADPVVDYGLLVVPTGEVAYLTHTGEHGSVALTEGKWRLWGQVAYGEELRRAAD